MGIDQQKVQATLAELPSIGAILGGIIRERLSAPNPECFLLMLLERSDMRILQWWEERCQKYLSAVESAGDAAGKLARELTGNARSNPPQQFNDRLNDAFAEISAVCELSTRGCSRFEPLVPPQVSKGKTGSAADYRCLVTPDPQPGSAAVPKLAYLEVKNMRAPVGIIDVFHRLYVGLSWRHPELAHRRIVLSHYWDNTATKDHVQTIKAFIASIAGCDVPYATSLCLRDGDKDIEVEVLVETGTGVCLRRGMGGDHPDGPFTKPEAFLRNATDKIVEGLGQLLRYDDAVRILAINVQSPDAIFTNDVGVELQRIVRNKSGGRVDCVLLHHHHFLEV